MRANTFVSPGKTRVERVPDPKILNDKRRDRADHLDGDLRLRPAPLQRLHPHGGAGRHLRPRVHGRGRRDRQGVKNLKMGDRVVVAFPIACGSCYQCGRQMYSLCENSNPNAWMAQKLMGHSPAGIFGYSHMLGGFAGGQAEYARVPFADVGTIKVPDGMPDEQVAVPLRHLPHRLHGRGDVRHQAGRRRSPSGAAARSACSPWPAPTCSGPSGSSPSTASPYRLQHGARAGQGGDDQLRGAGRLRHPDGDDRRPRAGLGASTPSGWRRTARGDGRAIDRAKQAVMVLENDRPHALREAIMCCRKRRAPSRSSASTAGSSTSSRWAR